MGWCLCFTAVRRRLFFFQAEDGIRDLTVTGVQTCALPICAVTETVEVTGEAVAQVETTSSDLTNTVTGKQIDNLVLNGRNFTQLVNLAPGEIGRASCRERV